MTKADFNDPRSPEWIRANRQFKQLQSGDRGLFPETAEFGTEIQHLHTSSRGHGNYCLFDYRYYHLWLFPEEYIVYCDYRYYSMAHHWECSAKPCLQNEINLKSGRWTLWSAMFLADTEKAEQQQLNSLF